MFEIGHGVIDLHAGRLDEALSRLQAGRWQLRAQDPDALTGLATAVCAYAAALQGEEETAGLLLGDLSQPRPPAAWLVARLTRYFELSAQAELGQRAASIRALAAEADNDAESSALAPALLFLSAATRLGDRQMGHKLGSLGGRVTGQFAALCSRLAEGMREADSELLLAASKDADASGNAVFARDAARKAVSCANDAGNRIALRIAQRAQQSLDDKFGSPKNGLHSLTTSTLTARECEVAVRAAAGTSNRKIAEQMHVSVRTVEGHLYQVYSKLHVASRSELKDVISTPATPPGSADPGSLRAASGPAFRGRQGRQEEPAMESLAESAPLIERSSLVKDLVRCLRDDTRSGAIVIGGAGTGKTAVVKAALRELGPRRHLIRLTATPALAAVPFGALAPYLSRLPDRELDSYAAVVEAMAGSLKSEADRPLFVVDDAHCLDHGTVGQLAQAAATGAAGILATCRPGPMIPEEFLSLWDDGIIAKFDLAPLSRTGTHQLCEQVLRADVSPWVSALFHDAADGNPLMLMPLIEHARSTGALGCRHGVGSSSPP